MNRKNNGKIEYNPLYPQAEENEDIFANWYENKFKKVSLPMRLAMSGEIAEEEVKNICEKFGISDWQKIGYTARIFRDIFCGDLKESGIEKIALEKIGIKQENLKVFIQLVKEGTRKMKKSGEEEYANLIDQVTLKEAIRKYPEIQEQLISDENLKLEGNEYPVAGTVKNWLTDYFQRAGGNKHDAMERSDYLFESESVNRLDEQEKNNLGVILMAFDSDSLIAIDKENKEIDFDESRFLLDGGDGKSKLKGIIDSYDSGLLNKNSFSNKKTDSGNKVNELKEKKKFEKIESTPRFEVDGDVNKRNENTNKDNLNLNTINLKEESVNEKEKEVETKQKNRKGRNILDLSDYIE